MKMTRQNYEAYFIDYLDGNLNASQMEELIRFLEMNPDLQAELEWARPACGEPEDMLFPGKTKLYKEKYDQDDEFNRMAVACMEGDAEESPKTEFEQYLAGHPGKRKEAERFEQTKLKPDITMTFPDKRKLYRSAPGSKILLWSTRIAAVLLLSFLAYRYGGNLVVKTTFPDPAPTLTEMNQEHEVPEFVAPEDNRKVLEKDPLVQDPEPVAPAKNALVVVREDKPVENRTVSGRSEPLSGARIPVKTPEKLAGRNVSFTLKSAQMTLHEMKTEQPDYPESFNEERLLVDVIRKKTGLGKLSVNRVAQAGLSLISSLSGENFSYETDSEGKITELAYDSHLLGFSIPTNRK